MAGLQTSESKKAARPASRALAKAIFRLKFKESNPGATGETITAAWPQHKKEHYQLARSILKRLEKRGYKVTKA